MSAVTIQVVGDQFNVRGGVGNIDQKLMVSGATSAENAATTVENWLYATYGATLSRGTVTVDDISGTEVGENIYDVTVQWRTYERKAPLQENEFEFSFSIDLEPVSVRVPIGQIAVFPATDERVEFTPQVLNDVGGQEDPEPVQIFEPTFEESVTWVRPTSQLTQVYRNKIKRLVGKTNATVFNGYSVGEALLTAVSGSRQGNSRAELRATWRVRENQSDLNIGDVFNIQKGGWDYLWPRTITQRADNGPAFKKITHVCVAQVFRRGNFAELEIPL